MAFNTNFNPDLNPRGVAYAAAGGSSSVAVLCRCGRGVGRGARPGGFTGDVGSDNERFAGGVGDPGGCGCGGVYMWGAVPPTSHRPAALCAPLRLHELSAQAPRPRGVRALAVGGGHVLALL